MVVSVSSVQTVLTTAECGDQLTVVQTAVGGLKKFPPAESGEASRVSHMSGQYRFTPHLLRVICIWFSGIINVVSQGYPFRMKGRITRAVSIM